VLTNSPGGVVLWGWLSELPNPGGSHDYAGCISLPRLLHITSEGHLHQQPLPQLNTLHQGPADKQDHLQLDAGATKHIGSTVPASYFDLQLTLAPATTATAADGDHQAGAVGVIIPAWSSSSNHSATADSIASVKGITGQGVLVMYEFSSSRLTVMIDDGIGQGLKPAGSAASNTTHVAECIEAASTAAAAGGKARNAAGGPQELRRRVLVGQLRLPPQQPLELRMLVDYSLLEVFTSDGQVLSTRVYRGVWPAGPEHGQQQQRAGVPAAADMHTDPEPTPANAASSDSDGHVMHDPVAAGCTSDSKGLGGTNSALYAVADMPCGCYLFAHGHPVVARNIHVAVMKTALVN
jgi:beta-fructofuranosidase